MTNGGWVIQQTLKKRISHFFLTSESALLHSAFLDWHEEVQSNWTSSDTWVFWICLNYPGLFCNFFCQLESWKHQWFVYSKGRFKNHHLVNPKVIIWSLQKLISNFNYFLSKLKTLNWWNLKTSEPWKHPGSLYSERRSEKDSFVSKKWHFKHIQSSQNSLSNFRWSK